MELDVKTGNSSYKVLVEKGILDCAGSELNLERKVLVVTDDGVPSSYAEKIMKASKEGYVYVIPQGEESKNIANLTDILSFLVDHDFSRKDCVIAVGGGVVGDLSGFAASVYMRGIDFYNVPTTLLSEVDSSIGGKTAVDFKGLKNIVGSFYPPKEVLIDPLTLKTLPERQIRAGLAEAIKMALCFDQDLFERIRDSKNLEDDIEDIIVSSLRIKKSVVEQDEKEKGLRKALNFGHTFGHAIEAHEKGKLLHGECVAIGMMYCASKEVKDELRPVLQKYGLPYETDIPTSELIPYILHDKKASGDMVSLVEVQKIGTFEIVPAKIQDLIEKRA